MFPVSSMVERSAVGLKGMSQFDSDETKINGMVGDSTSSPGARI